MGFLPVTEKNTDEGSYSMDWTPIKHNYPQNELNIQHV